MQTKQGLLRGRARDEKVRAGGSKLSTRSAIPRRRWRSGIFPEPSFGRVVCMLPCFPKKAISDFKDLKEVPGNRGFSSGGARQGQGQPPRVPQPLSPTKS